jgi:hypothetical protein
MNVFGAAIRGLALRESHIIVVRKRESGRCAGANRADPERWLSGRKRRIANPVCRETGITGSNPVLSADSRPVAGDRIARFSLAQSRRP